MSKVKFCFGIHNHQPVGNFGWVIEDAYQKSYLPFLKLLERYEFFRISLHFTGILFDWMKADHPKSFDLIRKLVGRGQIELLTGGFYEPILPIIPDRDKVAQIEKQTEFIRREFGVEPTGMWLAERVWEPTLPRPIKLAGVKYTILDDIHFRFSGMREEDLNGYYMTEDEGSTIALFPISRQLRYTIPFADPEETIAYLRDISSDSEEVLAIYADDGEKFGVWPETYKHCYEDGWLERFFSAIAKNLDWIEMTTFAEALKNSEPKGLTYLPTASYSEMNEWALPAKAIADYDAFVQTLKDADQYDENLAFVKGGFWRNFLSKYPETNLLHKKMLSLSRRLGANRDSIKGEKLGQIRDHIHAGQCNCPYWHGVFGGLYLPHLRGAVMQELVAAERLLQQAAKDQSTSITRSDFDCDGKDELVVRGEHGLAIVAPAKGGSIIELDAFSVTKNVVDIVGRRLEGYHHKLLNRDSETGSAKSIHDIVRVKEEGLEQLLIEDQYRRGLFLDHVYEDSPAATEMQQNTASEIASFSNAQYEVETVRDSNDGTAVSLTANVNRVSLGKVITFRSGVSEISAEYSLTNQGDAEIAGEFAVELGFGSFPFPEGESSILTASAGKLSLSETNDIQRIKNLLLHSRLYNFGILISSAVPFTLHSYPLHTVSLSEGGFEKIFQGVILVPSWPVNLESNGEFSAALDLKVVQGSESELEAL